MKKLVIVSSLLLLLASIGSSVTIDSPALSEYTQDPVISVEVSGLQGEMQYSVNGEENRTDKYFPVPQGKNVLVVYDVDNGETVDTATTEFFVDTEPPTVNSMEPSGTVFDISPHLEIGYSDISDVDTGLVEVDLDGVKVDGDATQTGFNASLDELSEGNHTVTYSVPDEHWESGGYHNASGSWNFTLPVEPVLSGTSPEGITGSSTTIELAARDPSGIDLENSYLDIYETMDRQIRLDEGDITSNESGISFEESFEGLEDGHYRAVASVKDNRGNTAREEWNFTVDTTPPEISIVSHLDGDVVKGEEEFQVNVSDLTDVESVDISIGTESQTVSEQNGLYSTSFDTLDLPDGEAELVVEAEDSGGNTGSSTVKLTVDNQAPVVEKFDLYPNPASGGLVVSATATDSATPISEMDYRLNSSDNGIVREGTLDSVSGSFDSQEETGRGVVDLETLDLATGTYTVSVQAEDSVDHRSSWSSSEVMVDNDLEPSLEIGAEEFKQEVGTTSEFTVKVSNTGEVDELVELSPEEGFETSVEPGEKRIQTGETKQFELELDIPESDDYLGNHSLELTADGLSISDTSTVELIVQPHPERREEIRGELQDLKDRLEDLNDTRQEWDIEGGVKEEFQSLQETIRGVEQLLEEGRYTRAGNILDSAEEQYQETETSLTGEVTRARVEILTSTVVKLLAFIAVIGIIYAGYRLIPEEGGYDPDGGYFHRPDGKHPMRLELEDRWRQLKEKRDEDDERTVERWESYED